MHRMIYIPEEKLIELYWHKNMRPREIAKLFCIKNERTIRKKMEKYGIKRRTLSEAMTTKFKKPFSGDLMEKAYFLGLRTGDFHARRMKKCIRLQTSTTHPALARLLEKTFQEYSQFCVYHHHKERQDELFIYVDLHPSFGFLLEKPSCVPQWVLENDDLFFSFLAAYMDCEGNWHLTKSHNIHSRFTFRLRTGDKETLENIKTKLEMLGYRSVFSLVQEKGMLGPSLAPLRKDIYDLTLNGKEQVMKLIGKLLPLSKHWEKIEKMKCLLHHHHSYYKEVRGDWLKIKERIKKEVMPLNE